jgi:cytochrome b
MAIVENRTTIRTRTSEEPALHRQVWDWPVRLIHWSLVVAFVGAFATNKLGVGFFVYHLWCGYAVIALVAFRILWGFFGTRHAKFVNFVRGPIDVLRYLSAEGRGRRIRYAGHNPLGAWMVVTLLSALILQAGFGLFANDEIFNVGPLSGFVSKTLSLQLTSLHRKMFYWIAAAVALHIAAVVYHSLFKREGLVRAMITGGKPDFIVRPEEAIKSSRLGRASMIFIAVCIAIAILVHIAPSPDLDLASF